MSGKKFNLKDEQNKLIHETFELYAQGTKEIDFHELKLSLKAFGFNNSNEEIKKIKEKLNCDVLNENQFTELMVERFAKRKPMEEAKIAFDLFRRNKNVQTIGADELFNAIKEAGDNTIKREDVAEIIKEFSGGDKINKTQFLSIMREYYYDDDDNEEEEQH